MQLADSRHILSFILSYIIFGKVKKKNKGDQTRPENLDIIYFCVIFGG